MPTEIQWTDETWNPVTGCTRVSPGCANCYIERTPPFRMAGRRFEIVGQASTTGVQLHPDRLEQPLRWRKPRRVFVCSLADLFHDDVPDAFVIDVFSHMALAPAHTFQVLTKRPERARALLAGAARCELGWLTHNGDNPTSYGGTGYVLPEQWPLPNVWLGVSIENARFTWRADVLREIPAAVRFISAEPLLGSLYDSGPRARPNGELDAPRELTASRPDSLQEDVDASDRARGRAPLDLTGIDWIIVGGESGPGARPFHLEHAREIIRAAHGDDPTGCYCPQEIADRGECSGRCHPAVFVKQLGARPVVTGEVAYVAESRLSRGFDCSGDRIPPQLTMLPVHEIVSEELLLRDSKGGDWDEWPADLRIREFPGPRA